MELARRAVVPAEAHQGIEMARRYVEHLGEVVRGRLGKRDVDPEEALARAECRDPLACGAVEPFDDRVHAARLGPGQDGSMTPRTPTCHARPGADPVVRPARLANWTRGLRWLAQTAEEDPQCRPSCSCAGPASRR